MAAFNALVKSKTGPVIAIMASLFLLASFSACSTQKIEDVATRKPQLSLEQFFEGQVIAYGIFEDYNQSLSRQFRVNILGTIEGDTLTLEEDFLYDDGETQRRVWVITNRGTDEAGITHYEGRADDVVGTAEGKVAGNALNWRYTLALPVDDDIYHIQFDDWIYQQDEHVAINRARLLKFGIEVGSVTLTFLRGPAAKAIGPLNLQNW
ncbi:MAG: DUF3833 domain-containing protein [Candidatus Puniceispirillaceae bacterium]